MMKEGKHTKGKRGRSKTYTVRYRTADHLKNKPERKLVQLHPVVLKHNCGIL